MSNNPMMHREAFNLLCNQEIGRGMSRSVFDSEILRDCVIKVESESCSFQNVIEWETWQRVKDTNLSDWFAPCRWISPNGSILVMEKTERVAKTAYPEKMHIFFTDFKYLNYGFYDGRIVCHDYGTSLIFEYGMTKRMKKADWWD